MSRLGVEFSDDELEEMVNRSNIDTLVALISMSRRLFIHKKNSVSMRFFTSQDLKIFHKHEFSTIKCQQNIQNHTVIGATRINIYK